MTFWEIKYIFEIIPLNSSKVYRFSASGHTHAQFSVTLFHNLSDIPDFPKSRYACSVTFAVKTEMRYAKAPLKTNLYNFKSSLK